MAIIDWPTSQAFRPVLPYRFGVRTPKSGWRGFYTGEYQGVGHLADRMTLQFDLPPCTAAQADERAGFFAAAMSAADTFRFPLWHHQVPNGSLRGSPTVAASALAGARSVQLQGATVVTPEGSGPATLNPGDVIGIGGNLALVAPPGATANLAGAMTVPLAMPLMRPAPLGTVVNTVRPTGLWELTTYEGAEFDLLNADFQAGLPLSFQQRAA